MVWVYTTDPGEPMTTAAVGASAKGSAGRDLPRPFERRRLMRALRANGRLLLAVLVFGLFGGAAVARFAVPLDYAARTVVKVESQGAVAALAWAQSDRIVDTARHLAGLKNEVAELRKRIDIEPLGPTRIAITAHASESAPALALADAMAAAFVAELLRHAAEERSRADANRRTDLASAQLERDRAEGDLFRALNLEGISDLEGTLHTSRQRLAELEAAISEARVIAATAETRGAVLGDASAGRGAKASSAALVEAQRALSTALTQHDANDPEVLALRDRIRRLQSSAVTPGRLAVGNRAEARAQQARALQLEREANGVRASIVRLSEVAQRLSPLLTARERARERVADLQRATSDASRMSAAAEIQARASIQRVQNRDARMLAALLAPLLALLLAMGVVVANEVRDFRVCASTELAHWIAAPVVARSEWPGRSDRLEVLIDELAEFALDAPGTMLVLPLTDLERPLALTIASQLNGRAQRHFRTATGARITVAQAWEGDGTGPRVKRAADVADRVLWVVSADTHKGPEIAQRREVISRSAGVAAVLLDADAHGVSDRVGDASAFWASQSDNAEAARSVPPSRVPLH